MACVAVHSHMLCGLLIAYIMIIIVLLISGAYGIPTTTSTVGNNTIIHNFEVNEFKVLVALSTHGLCVICLIASMIANNVTKCSQIMPPVVIITILVFNLVFNVTGCISLWMHKDPNRSNGYSHSIRGAAVMSTITTLYSVWTAAFYCWRQPEHPSIKIISTTPLQTKDVIKKEEGENKNAMQNAKLKTKTRSKKSEEKPKDVEIQEALEPKRPSEGFEKDSRLSVQKNVVEGDDAAKAKKTKSEKMRGGYKDAEKKPKHGTSDEKEDSEMKEKSGKSMTNKKLKSEELEKQEEQ